MSLQEEFISKALSEYHNRKRIVPSKDALMTIFYTLLYSQQLDEAKRSLFLKKPSLPKNIINQYNNDRKIQENLSKAITELQLILNEDKKYLRERWQLAAKKAWQQLPIEKRKELTEKLKAEQEQIQHKAKKKQKF
jgi:hypothetical protein